MLYHIETLGICLFSLETFHTVINSTLQQRVWLEPFVWEHSSSSCIRRAQCVEVSAPRARKLAALGPGALCRHCVWRAGGLNAHKHLCFRRGCETFSSICTLCTAQWPDPPGLPALMALSFPSLV